MAKLDGSEKMEPTPFDAHEQVVRGPHVHALEGGYSKVEYAHQEYPKAISHDEKTGEPVIVASAEEEEEES